MRYLVLTGLLIGALLTLPLLVAALIVAGEPAFGEKLKVLGIEIVGGGRKELDAFRASERKRITELVKASGVQIK